MVYRLRKTLLILLLQVLRSLLLLFGFVVDVCYYFLCLQSKKPLVIFFFAFLGSRIVFSFDHSTKSGLLSEKKCCKRKVFTIEIDFYFFILFKKKQNFFKKRSVYFCLSFFPVFLFNFWPRGLSNAKLCKMGGLFPFTKLPWNKSHIKWILFFILLLTYFSLV